jgi:hypothetical protein
MKNIILICAIPLAIIIYMMLFSYIMELIREPSDMSILIAVVAISVTIFGTILLTKYIIKTIKK